MIPTVEEIVKMLLANQCGQEQAMGWLEQHFQMAIEEAMNEHSSGTRASVRPSVGDSGTQHLEELESALRGAHEAYEYAVAHTETAEGKVKAIIDYIDGFYVSGNSVPIDRPWINAASWGIAKELLALGLPLEHALIEQECVYRRKLAAYGDETRAKSPLQERLLAVRTDSARSGDQIKPDVADQGSVRNATDMRKLLKDAKSLTNTAFNEGRCSEHEPGWKDESGCTMADYARACNEIELKIDAAIRALPDQKD